MAGLEAYVAGVPGGLGAFADDPMGAATAAMESRRRAQVENGRAPAWMRDIGANIGNLADQTVSSFIPPALRDRLPSPEMVGNLVLGALPGSGDYMAARDALESSAASLSALGRGDYMGAGARGVDALAAGLGIMPFLPYLASIKGVKNPIRAYHGSPHDFDRFDMSKIGTGEGGQAYGRGLYFAENEGVARSYRDALKYRALVDPSASPLDPKRIAGELYESWQGDIAGALDDARHYDNARSIIAELRKIAASPPAGRMYEVDIHADPSRFLDWDAPLSAQTPPVRSALNDLGVRLHEPEWTVRQSPSGRWTVYNVWGESSGTFKDKGAAEAKAAAGTRDHNVGAAGLAYTRLGGNHVYGSLDGGGASQALNDAGIPGIKYLDKGSRSAGDGTRNYVVFDDKLIEILRKYGIMAPVAGLGALAASGQDDPNL